MKGLPTVELLGIRARMVHAVGWYGEHHAHVRQDGGVVHLKD